MDPRILRERDEKEVATDLSCPPACRTEWGTSLDEGGGEEVSGHKEEVLHDPLQWAVVQKQEARRREGDNALHHGFVCGVQHSGPELMGLALELKWLGAHWAPEIHNLGTCTSRLQHVRYARGTVEFPGNPGLGDCPRSLRSTCEGRGKRGIHGEPHGPLKAMSAIYALR